MNFGIFCRVLSVSTRPKTSPKLLTLCSFVIIVMLICLSLANFFHFLINPWSRYASGSVFKRLLFVAVLWIPDILVRIWTRGSVPLTYESGPGSYSFRQWLSRFQSSKIKGHMKSQIRIHITSSWCRNSSADITKSLRGDGSGLAFDAHNPWIDPLR